MIQPKLLKQFLVESGTGVTFKVCVADRTETDYRKQAAMAMAAIIIITDIPLLDAVGRLKTVPPDGNLPRTARALGISLGE